MNKHLVGNHFTTDSGRKAVAKRWQNYRNRNSVEANRKAVDEYFAEKGIEPHEANPNVFLAATMVDTSLPIDMRILAATKLQPYYNGPPPKEPPKDEVVTPAQEAASDEKRQRAFQYILGLAEENSKLTARLADAKSGQSADDPPPAEHIEAELAAEPVPKGEEYKPGQSPLFRKTIDTDASEPKNDT